MEKKTFRITKRDIIYIFFKRKIVICSLIFFTVVLVTVGVYITPLPHKAIATIYVDRVRPSVPIISRENAPLYQYLDRDEVINSEIEIIQSRSVMEKVVDDLQLDKLPSTPLVIDKYINKFKDWLVSIGLTNRVSKRESFIKKLQVGVKVKSYLNSNLINISYLSREEDPVLITKIVNGAVKAYFDKRLSMLQETDAHRFFTSQMENSKRFMEELEEKITKFKENKLIVSVDEQKHTLVQNRAGLEALLQQIEREHEQVKTRLEHLTIRGQYVPFKEDRESYKILDEMGLLLLNMEIEKEKALHHFIKTDSKVMNLEKQIELLFNKMIGTLTALSKSLELEKESIIKQIIDVNDKINSLNKDAIILNNLNITLDVAEKNYLLYAEKIEQYRIVGLSDTSFLNIKVTDYATVPPKPVFSRLIIVLFATVLATILGFGLALILEYFDHSINSEDDVSYYLNIKPLAAFPRIRSKVLRV